MNIIYNYIKKYKISKICFVSFFVMFFLSIYFLVYAIFGEDGLGEYSMLKNTMREKIYTQNSLLNTKQLKESKVIQMRSQSLDLDLLDEEVRKNLGYVEDNEVMMYNDKNNQDQ